jgi:hypothetical protein
VLAFVVSSLYFWASSPTETSRWLPAGDIVIVAVKGAASAPLAAAVIRWR